MGPTRCVIVVRMANQLWSWQQWIRLDLYSAKSPLWVMTLKHWMDLSIWNYAHIPFFRLRYASQNYFEQVSTGMNDPRITQFSVSMVLTHRRLDSGWCLCEILLWYGNDWNRCCMIKKKSSTNLLLRAVSSRGSGLAAFSSLKGRRTLLSQLDEWCLNEWTIASNQIFCVLWATRTCHHWNLYFDFLCRNQRLSVVWGNCKLDLDSGNLVNIEESLLECMIVVG